MTEMINIPIARETRVDTQSESSKSGSAKTGDKDFAETLNKVESRETQNQQVKDNAKTEEQPVKVDGNKENDDKQIQPEIVNETKKSDAAQEVPALVLMAMQNLTPQLNNQQQVQQTQNGQAPNTEEEKTDKSAVSEIDTKTNAIDESLIKTAMSQISGTDSTKSEISANTNPVQTKTDDVKSPSAEVNLKTTSQNAVQTSDNLTKELNTADLANQLVKSATRELASTENTKSDLKSDSKSVKEAFFTLSSASANAMRVQSELNIGKADQLSSNLDNKVEQATNAVSVTTIPISAAQTTGNSNNFAGTNSQDSQNAAFAAQLSSKSVENIDVAKEVQPAVKMPDSELQQRIIDQVVHEVKLSKLADRSDLVVRLTPPELGTLKIKLVQDASGMTTQIQTSSEQVKNLLQAHVPAIVESLSNAGVKLDKVTVAHEAAFNSTFAQNFSQSNTENQPKQSGRRSQSFARQVDGIDTLTAASMIRNEAIGGTAYSWLA